MSKLILPIEQVALKVAAAGFTGWQVVTGIAIIRAEGHPTSPFDAYCINVVGERLRPDGSPNPAYRSLDVGLFAINTYWNPDVTVSQLLDPDENVRVARRIVVQRFTAKAGSYSEKVTHAWSAWVTYQKGLHKPFEVLAATAAKAIGVNI